MGWDEIGWMGWNTYQLRVVQRPLRPRAVAVAEQLGGLSDMCDID